MRRQGTDDHQAVRLRQPYEVELEGISLVVCKDVFPPDVGTISRHMSRAVGHNHPASGLDMGCGTGFLALAMRQAGIPKVWAVDIHPLAVECARANLARNPRLRPIEICQSDLFASIPPEVGFDLIAFNQPFFASTEDIYIAATNDGGRPIIVRFLEAARGHLNPGGTIMMPFQSTSGDENDPRTIAIELGFDVRVLVREDVGEINWVWVFEREVP